MKNLFFALFLALLTACGGGKNSKDEPILVEARKVHKEAIQIHNQVMKDLKEVKKMREAMEKSISAEALKDIDIKTEAVEKKQKQIDACKAQEMAMAEWMNSIQEVPGGEAHDHHDHEGHDHNHDHKPTTQASAQDVLAFQKEMKKNIEKIQQEVQSFLKK